jgi:translation elongation factor TU
VAQGAIRVGEPVEVVGLVDEPLSSVVTGLETFGQAMEHAEAGDNTAMLLRGIKREQVRRGQVVSAPGSIRPHTRFRARVRVLTADEGGRRTPILAGYQPQFHFRTTHTGGTILLIEGQQALPGDTRDMTVELGKPIALAAELGFAIREGGRTVGAGTVVDLD